MAPKESIPHVHVAAASLNTGPPQKQTPAQKRSARYAKAQGELTAAQLAEQDAQNRTPSKPPLVEITKYELQMAARWFTEFMHDQHPDVDVDATYFSPGGQQPDTVLMKEYARYLVRSRVGRISDKLSVCSMEHYMAMIISIIERQCKYPRGTFKVLREEVRNFVTNDLVQQEGVSTMTHMKGVAHTEDLTFIMSRLYDPAYLNTFPNMRTVFNLTLYMCLVVDLCGRGCEIARNPKRPEHMCLRWEDVTFVTFQREDDDSFDIRAQIKVRWSKGQSLDESEFRIISFPGLLPTSMATQDTLRLLLVGALMDSVFSDGVQTWDDLFCLRAPAAMAATGQRIKMKKSMLTIPVLRRVDTKRRLTQQPVITGDMQIAIRRLGRYCGFEHRLVAYCLRRGVAFILANQTTVENRKALMGHKSTTAYTPYHSMFSTIDFVAMFRTLDSRPVNAQYGMSLNRSTAAPTTLSVAGQQAVLQREDVRAAAEQMESVRAAILQDHASLAAATRTDDPRWYEFMDASNVRRSLIQVESKRMYSQEYAQHFENLRVTSTEQVLDDIQVDSGSVEEWSHGTRVDLAERSAVPDDSLFIPDETALLQAGEEMPPLDGDDDLGQALQMIGGPSSEGLGEDFLFEVMGHDSDDEEIDPFPPTADVKSYAEFSNRGESLHTSFTIQADTLMEGVQSSKALPDLTDPSTVRLHGVPPETRNQRGKNRISMKGRSAYNDMLADLERVKANESDLSQTLLSWYKIMHSIDEFPLGEEPLPGTYSCRFCDEDLATVHHPHEHSHACAKADAEREGQAMLTLLCPPSQPCQYQRCGTGAQAQTFVSCDETFNTARERGEHMHDHVRSMVKKDANGNKVPTCFFEQCAANPEGGRRKRNGPDFDSVTDQLHHMWSQHHVSTLKTVNVEFCEFCHIWLIEPHEWRTHAIQHLDDAQSVVTSFGYNGARAGRSIVPRLCPFCFHDEDLEIYERVFGCGREGYFGHLVGHLASQKQTASRLHCPASPSLCNRADDMDVAQMTAHLEEVHRIDLPERQFGRFKPLHDVTNFVQPGRKARKKKEADDAATLSNPDIA